MNRQVLGHYIASCAVAFVFIIYGIWEVVNPSYWTIFIPQFLGGFSGLVLVALHGILLFIFSILLVTPKTNKIGAILSSLILIQIIITLIFETGISSLIVSDIALLAVTISLIFSSPRKNK